MKLIEQKHIVLIRKPQKGNEMDTKTSPIDKFRVNEQKWTKTLMEAGWTVIPNVFIERQNALGLHPIDINILLHLAVYWWTHDNRPHPSKNIIAKAINVTPRTVQRRIAALENIGFIRREQRRILGKGSKTNVYHLDGLIKAAHPYALEKIKYIKEHKDEQKKRSNRKRPIVPKKEDIEI